MRGDRNSLNLNVAVIMPPGAERESLKAHLERQNASVILADSVDDFLSGNHEETCSLGVLDFGRNGSYPADRRDAVSRLKQSWPRMQLALWLDREEAIDAAEMNASGIRNIFLKPLRNDAMDALLRAAGKSVVRQAREQRETARVE